MEKHLRDKITEYHRKIELINLTDLLFQIMEHDAVVPTQLEWIEEMQRYASVNFTTIPNDSFMTSLIEQIKSMVEEKRIELKRVKASKFLAVKTLSRHSDTIKLIRKISKSKDRKKSNRKGKEFENKNSFYPELSGFSLMDSSLIGFDYFDSLRNANDYPLNNNDMDEIASLYWKTRKACARLSELPTKEEWGHAIKRDCKACDQNKRDLREQYEGEILAEIKLIVHSEKDEKERKSHRRLLKMKDRYLELLRMAQTRWEIEMKKLNKIPPRRLITKHRVLRNEADLIGQVSQTNVTTRDFSYFPSLPSI